MKKFASILLVAAMALSLVACGGGDSSSASTSTPAAGGSSTAASTPAEGGKGKIAYIVGNLGDKSFSDSGEAGMNVLRGEGWDVKTFELGDATKADKYEDGILDALDQGYEYIVGSSTYLEIMIKLAPDYPEVKFVGFDEKKEDADLPENVTCIFYAQNEGSYLVGMMAAAMSKTGTVAVDVGVENPVINDFVTGYIQGVMDWNEANGTDVKAVKAAVDSWTDPAKMKQLCLDQARNNNADVFYQVAGGSGDGLFEACVESKTWAIGVDSDQYQMYKDGENPEKADVILTSMLKEVGNSFVSLFHQIEKGDTDSIWGHTITLGLAQDSVGYVDNAFFQENVPEEIRTAMSDAAAKVKAGDLKVKSYYDFADEAEYNAFVEAAK